jgi:hypothetical protein
VEDRLSGLSEQDIRIERIDVMTREEAVEVSVLYLLPLDRTLYTAVWSVTGATVTPINDDAIRLDAILDHGE